MSARSPSTLISPLPAGFAVDDAAPGLAEGRTSSNAEFAPAVRHE